MPTSRSLTVCRSLLPGVVSAQGGGRSAPRGVSALGGVCSWGVCLLWGVSAPRGCLLLGVVSALRVSAVGGCLLPGGVSALGGVCPRRGVCSGGYLLLGGGLLRGEGVVSQHALRQTPPTVNRITHTCKNITLAQLRCGR